MVYMVCPFIAGQVQIVPLRCDSLESCIDSALNYINLNTDAVCVVQRRRYPDSPLVTVALVLGRDINSRTIYKREPKGF